MLKVFWSICGPREGNFGDKLTPLLLDYFGIPYEWTCMEEAEMFGIGSLIEKIPPGFRGIVWTSGMMYEESRQDLRDAFVLAVRGRLTLERLKCDRPAVLGDGGLLCSLFAPRAKKRYKLGLIPHFVDAEDPLLKEIASHSAEIKIVDICGETQEVIRSVGQCEHILSSSLHGLILADTLGIPCDWIELNNSPEVVWGHGFKFRDYFSIYGQAEKRSVSLSPSDRLDTLLPVFDGYQRPGLADIQRELISAFESLADRQEVRYWKKAVLPYEQREADLLDRLKSSSFDRADATDGSLDSLESSKTREELRCHPRHFFEFIDRCLRLLAELDDKGVLHRNIRPDQLFVRDRRPVLSGFHYAIPREFAPEPTGAVDGSHASPLQPDDLRSIGAVFRAINDGRYPLVDTVLFLMRATGDTPDCRNLDVLRTLFRSVEAYEAETGSSTTGYEESIPAGSERETTDRAIVCLLRHIAGLTRERAQREHRRWCEEIEDTLDLLRAVIPRHVPFILVDDGQWGDQVPQAFPDHVVFPFVEREGIYWGPPSDDEEAIRETERLRCAGAGYLAIGLPAFWWLEHYTAWRDELESRFTCRVSNRRLILYNLREERNQ